MEKRGCGSPLLFLIHAAVETDTDTFIKHMQDDVFRCIVCSGLTIK